MYIIDNYQIYTVDDTSYCVALSCDDRYPMGDSKTCSLPDDMTTCYYKAPQTSCTVSPCPKV
jgi:hypothetical protein